MCPGLQLAGSPFITTFFWMPVTPFWLSLDT